MPKIAKLLIANRGEIACRIIRTAKDLGIRTVAVFSEADRTAPHVRIADEAVCIGPAPSNQSYLLKDKIIEAAQTTGADAIHPGYGFLSEKSDFAKAVRQAGLIFVGPSEEAIDIMGDKIRSKEAVAKYGVPLVPGSEGALNDVEEAKSFAQHIGFPVMLKASAGGGGKGMRIAHSMDELQEQFQLAVSEAEKAFGDGSVFIERFIQNPRHIEVQILADQHGNYVHLFERECSVQRRHQKVIEEAPSAVVTPEMRKELGDAAVNVAKACDYHNAGTVEFIMDENGEFFFLEMNTRLQVEHPVTEMITGLDLVEWQLRIAQGDELSLQQEDLSMQGHSIEVRVYAEDPDNNFLPDTGLLVSYQPPKGPGVRVDDGMTENMEVPVYYDPMIAKLVVHAETRDKAMDRMVRAIEEYEITGCKTTLSFGKYVMQHEAFRTGQFSTKFVEAHFEGAIMEDPDEETALTAALMAFQWQEKNETQQAALEQLNQQTRRSAWKANRKWAD